MASKIELLAFAQSGDVAVDLGDAALESPSLGPWLFVGDVGEVVSFAAFTACAAN